MHACHSCGTEITESVGFRSTCPGCHAYLHCCLNCRLYSPSAHNHCLSSTTEYVGDVAKVNFCEEFDFVNRQKDRQAPDQGRSRFDALFGD